MAKGIWYLAARRVVVGCWLAQAVLIGAAQSAEPGDSATDQPTDAAQVEPTTSGDDEVIVSDKPTPARRPRPTVAKSIDEDSAGGDQLKPIPQKASNPVSANADTAAGESSEESSPPPSTLEGKAMVVQAFQLTKTADTETAYTSVIDLCREALRAALPKDTAAYARRLAAWAHNRRGEVCADDGRSDQALTNFMAAVELDPQHWRAVHNRGVTLATQGLYDEAIADFNRTIQLNRNYANAWFNRGELYYEQGDYARAVQDYSESIRLAPDDSAALNGRGHAYYRLEKFREAALDYNAALRIDPQNAAAYTNRGDVYSETGDYEQAANDYRAAIRLDPESGRAYQSTAWLMATCPHPKYRNGKLAVEAARKAIELEGDSDYRYLETLAAAQASAGDFSAAQRTQARVLQVVPKDHYERSEQRMELYKKNTAYREAPRQLARAKPGETPRRAPPY